MKKGLVAFAFSIVMIAIFCAGMTQAVMCSNGIWSDTGCVCGHSPNSTLGYGQVIIGGLVYSCDNIDDGLCPEDFADPTGFIANCTYCPDPDCTATVMGTVTDSNGRFLDRVVVEGHPVKFNPSANLDRNASTNIAGAYGSGAFITGKYYFSASKDAYDTQMLEASIIRGATTTLNFVLNNGTCHDDCTNSYNRCNSLCDGVTFNDSNTRCQFYNETVKRACNNKLKGTEVNLGPVDGEPNYAWVVECCADDPATNPFEEPFKKYYATAEATCNANNVIRVEKIARYNDVPVRIVINYWD
jgi:hypothetical protein